MSKTQLFDLDGKIAFVSGASRGIGEAIAKLLAQQGAHVIVSSRKLEGCQHVADAIIAAGGKATAIACHIGEMEQISQVFAGIKEQFGRLDILVNNAAVATSAETAHPVAGVSYADWQRIWRRTLDVNLAGAANLSYCVARHLIGRGAPGRIVNIGSRGAFKGEPDHPAYGASKAALHALGQSLAVSLAPHGISVTSVAPGFTATERVADRIDDTLRAQSPFGRVGTPEEVAAAVVYLASAEATWASGTILDLNGASHLRM